MPTSIAPTMPTVFVGHGSPMNALADNKYTHTLKKWAEQNQQPKSILCISAHWQTTGTQVTSSFQPRTIHDFYGFPEELFKVQYPAPGDPPLAFQIAEMIQQPHIALDNGEWGFDHGTWSVLKHMYPKADIPVLQMSLDVNKNPQQHFELGQKLSFLRDRGVLIIGSGNIVHNLRQIKWQADAAAFGWAQDFDNWYKGHLKTMNFIPLIEDFQSTEAGRLSVPTTEHYLPSLYILGASRPTDQSNLVYEEMQNASISMTSFSFT